ncbi:T9SS type A sorting domain-containing protein [Flavicella sediminum]|uniref:T9SS type A sorting domain-containing protein n=1 Tax=Flavicella sediminum TaxID=2585141 RepID=UPI00112334C1|nr:T9SS type A sorting domain-containing protein [Flavicella sediminum]
MYAINLGNFPSRCRSNFYTEVAHRNLKDGNYLCTEDGKVNVSIENVSQTDFEYQEPIIPEENVNTCESLVLGITSEKELIKIYPNPIKGALFVTAANSYKLDIYSTTSSLIFSEKENEGGQVHSYNVSKLVSGFYIVKLTMNSGIETKIIYID